MKVYVVDEFIRKDETCEHQSGILKVFSDEDIVKITEEILA